MLDQIILTAKVAVVQEGNRGHLNDTRNASTKEAVMVSTVVPRMADAPRGIYKTPMLIAIAAPIFSLLYMLYLSSSLQGSKARAKSQNAEHAVTGSCQLSCPPVVNVSGSHLPPVNKL
jgi:hypothetical protein